MDQPDPIICQRFFDSGLTKYEPTEIAIVVDAYNYAERAYFKAINAAVRITGPWTIPVLGIPMRDTPVPVLTLFEVVRLEAPGASLYGGRHSKEHFALGKLRTATRRYERVTHQINAAIKRAEGAS